MRQNEQEAWNAAHILGAVGFTATIFANRRYNTERFATQREAEARAREMTAAATNSRQAMVYAITPDDFTIYVSTPSPESA